MVNGRLTRVELPPEMADNAAALTAITQDASGGMWVSFGPAGLYRLKDGVWTKYGGRSDLPTSGVLIAFTDTLGRVWFGSTRNRLAVLDGDRVQAFGPGDGVQVGNVTGDSWTRIGDLDWRGIWIAAIRSWDDFMPSTSVKSRNRSAGSPESWRPRMGIFG